MPIAMTRRAIRTTALLALILFAAWIGSAWLHAHAADPSCQICKALHASQANLVGPGGSPAPLESSGRVAAPAAPATGILDETIPQGRAPPTA
jgi:hypothetical protein